jgi:RHS repeat-associated protein
VAKKINGAVVKKWIYRDKLSPAAEFDGAGTLVARYIEGVTVKSGISYRVLSDHLGTPRLLVNSTTGAIAQRLDIDEWGQVTADSSAGFQVLGFAGGIYDPDTGLVRFGARDYDPVVGRWTAKDPIQFRGGDMDLYGYVFGDPVNSTDPTGLQGAGTDQCSYYNARCIANAGDYYCVEAPKWCQRFGNSTWANCVRACLISWDSALHPSSKPYTPAYDDDQGLCVWSSDETPDNSWPWTSTNNFAAHAACYASCGYSPPYAPPNL